MRVLRIRRGPLAALTLAVAVGATPAVLRAHGGAGDASLGHARPTSEVSARFETAGFHLGGHAGRYHGVVLDAEYAPWPVASLSLRVPAYVLDLDDDSPHVGLGDPAVTGRVRLLGGEAGQPDLSLGLSLEVPLGDADHGIGSGHFELDPFVAASHDLAEWTFHGALGLRVSLVGQDHDAAASHTHEDGSHDGGAHHETVFVDPHGDLELVYHAGLLYRAGEQWFLNLTGQAATVLSEADRGDTFVTVGPEVGYRFSERWRALLSGGIPVAGPDRYDWRVSGGATHTFGP